MLNYSFLSLKYFLPCSERVLVAKLLFELLLIPKLELRLQTISANLLIDLLGYALTSSKLSLAIFARLTNLAFRKRRLRFEIAKQLTIPWRPLLGLLDV